MSQTNFGIAGCYAMYVTRQLKTLWLILFSDMKRIRALLPGSDSTSASLRFFMILTGMCEVGTIYVLTLFGTIAGYPDMAKNSLIVRGIVKAFPGSAIHFEDERFIIFLAACLVVVFVVAKNIITAATSWRTLLFSERISLRIGNEIMRRYLLKPYIWHLSDKGRETFQAMNFRSYLTTLVTNILSLPQYTTKNHEF